MTGHDCTVIYDAVPAFDLFRRIKTQWRVSSSAVIGLDYAAIGPVMDMMAVPHDQRLDLLDDLQVIEQSILHEIRKK